MTAVTITEARKNLYQLVAETAQGHKPLLIKGKHNNAVLVGEEDWNAEQETLYVLQNQKLMKQISDSLNPTTSHKKLSQEELHAEFDL